jgi:hypothetical protein
MNIKKSLESRIRGWFPKEPDVAQPEKSNIQKLTSEQNQTPDLLAGRIVMVVLMGYLACLTILLFSSMFTHYQATQWLQLGGIGLGWLLGSLITVSFTRKKLRLLKEKGEIRRSIKLVVLSSLVYFILIVFPGTFILTDLPIEILAISGEFAISVMFGNLISDFILTFRWERENKMRVIGGGFWKIYAVPKVARPKANTTSKCEPT